MTIVCFPYISEDYQTISVIDWKKQQMQGSVWIELQNPPLLIV